MIKAKEVLKDKFWIVEEHGQNVATYITSKTTPDEVVMAMTKGIDKNSSESIQNAI